MFTGSINLSKVKKDKLFTSEKGEKFLNITVWLNDEPDNYGNLMSIQERGKKGEPVNYLGNLKEYAKEQTSEPQKPPVSDGIDPDLGF
jgi:hypothetical protein